MSRGCEIALSPAVGLLPLMHLGVPYDAMMASRRGMRLVMMRGAS